jgi:DNA-directed RNA polymerase specialized sigma24 family protein
MEIGTTINEEQYNRLREKLSMFFHSKFVRSKFRPCESEIEDLAQETLKLMLEQLDNGVEISTTIDQYVIGIAKHVWSKYFRQRIKKVSVGEVRDINPPKLQWLHPLTERCLDKCLQRLEPEDRNLLRRYYAEGDKEEEVANRLSIAEQLEITSGALRLRVVHIIAKYKLKQCVDDCMKGK